MLREGRSDFAASTCSNGLKRKAAFVIEATSFDILFDTMSITTAPIQGRPKSLASSSTTIESENWTNERCETHHRNVTVSMRSSDQDQPETDDPPPSGRFWTEAHQIGRPPCSKAERSDSLEIFQAHFW
jgi:hypothetical protein